MIKSMIFIFLLLMASLYAVAQQDSLQYDDSDTSYYMSKRNSLGVNISPLFTTAFGGSNKASKVTASYKRNYGEKNIRMSLNYLNLANRTPYYAYIPISSTDSSITNRYYGTNYKHYDVRFGFEEIKGANFSQFHIGADLIFGYANFISTYDDLTLEKDSVGNYLLTAENNTPLYTGRHTSNYFVTGLDVSFGFDWFLSDEFTITLQLTPQFNYFIADWERLEDKYKEYSPISNYANFSLGYFDILLFYRF